MRLAECIFWRAQWRDSSSRDETKYVAVHKQTHTVTQIHAWLKFQISKEYHQNLPPLWDVSTTCSCFFAFLSEKYTIIFQNCNNFPPKATFPSRFPISSLNSDFASYVSFYFVFILHVCWNYSGSHKMYISSPSIRIYFSFQVAQLDSHWRPIFPLMHMYSFKCPQEKSYTTFVFYPSQ